MKTGTHTTEIPAEFKIDAVTLANFYQSFLDTQESLFIKDGDKLKGYKLAHAISFNNFKIYFRRELESLGLSTTLDKD